MNFSSLERVYYDSQGLDLSFDTLKLKIEALRRGYRSICLQMITNDIAPNVDMGPKIFLRQNVPHG